MSKAIAEIWYWLNACILIAVLHSLPDIVFANEASSNSIPCLTDPRNPIFGCWARFWRDPDAIWSFHPDGRMRNGFAGDLVLGKTGPGGAGEFYLRYYGAAITLSLHTDDAQDSRWPTVVLKFNGMDTMHWYNFDGSPDPNFHTWNRVYLLPLVADSRFSNNPDDVSVTAFQPIDFYGEWEALAKNAYIVTHIHPNGTLDIFNSPLGLRQPDFREHERYNWTFVNGVRPYMLLYKIDNQGTSAQFVRWWVSNGYSDHLKLSRATRLNPFWKSPAIDTLFFQGTQASVMSRSNRGACRYLADQVKQILPVLESLTKSAEQENWVYEDLRNMIKRRSKELLEIGSINKEQYEELFKNFSEQFEVNTGLAAGFFAERYCTENKIIQIACGTARITLRNTIPVKLFDTLMTAKDTSYAVITLGWNKFFIEPEIESEIKAYTDKLMTLTAVAEREVQEKLGPFKDKHAELAADIGVLGCKNFDSGVGTYPESEEINNFDICWLRKSIDNQQSICQ